MAQKIEVTEKEKNKMGLLDNILTTLEISRKKKEASQTNYLNRNVYVMPYVNKEQLKLTKYDKKNQELDIYRYDTTSTTPALDFIWGGDNLHENHIISGGSSEERSRAVLPFVTKNQNHKIPIIALHTGNNELITVLKNNSIAYEGVSKNDQYYDVFRSMVSDDIVYLLYESSPKDFKNPKAELLLRAIVEVLLLTDGKVTFHGLANFPFARFMDILNKLQIDGDVTSDEYDDISGNFMAGSSELAPVKNYLSKLNRQVESIFGVPNAAKLCNMNKILNQKGIISIDVGLGNNDLVITYITNQLLLYQASGREFAIILDNIMLAIYPKLCDLLRDRMFCISHSDFISSLSGGERQSNDIFAEITGTVSVLVLLNHKSITNCQKWSDHLGKYKKIKIKNQLSTQNSTSFLTSGSTRGITDDETYEQRVPAETISVLPPALACVHRNQGTLFAQI